MRRRRKPRLFSFPREVELAWFDEATISGSDRLALEAVVDAFIAIASSKKLEPNALDALAKGAAWPQEQVRGMAITRLAVLCHYFADAIQKMEQLIDHPDPAVRIFLCAALANTPEGVAVPLLARLLKDDEWGVRKAAAKACSAIPWESSVEMLRRRVETEPDARVRVVVQLALDFQLKAA